MKETKKIIGSIILVATGIVCALVGLWWLEHHTGFSKSFGIDLKIADKWAGPTSAKSLPIAYRRPGVTSGRYFFRRNQAQDHGNILARGAEASGFSEHPYSSLPSIDVSYGRYGFRDEYQETNGAVAVLGSSYVEAGFAAAEETVVGWLRREHGLPAVNYGMARAGGFAVVHFLERFVLPSKPSQIIWIFNERSDFDRLLEEYENMEEVRKVDPRLGTLGFYLRHTAKSFLVGGYHRLLSSFGQSATEQSAPERIPKSIVWQFADREQKVHLSFPPQSEVLTKTKPLLDEALAKLSALASRVNASLTVVYLPSRTSLFQALGALDESDADSKAAYEALQNACQRHNITLTTVKPSLVEAMQNGEMVINPIFDQHLSSSGMRLAAQVVANSMH